jgi:hypothetical protein
MKLQKAILPLLLLTMMSVRCTDKEFNAALNTAQKAASDYNGGSSSVLSPNIISNGLKQALENGVGRGVDVLSARNGFWSNMAVRILLPPQAQDVEVKLRQLGLGNLVDKCLQDINHAAEDAATGARPIFVQAITSMTFNDAKNILMGTNKSAATDYLQKATSEALYQSFKPVIFNSLNKVGAMNTWKDVTTKYNAIPFVQKVNPDLADHVTHKAMDALFQMIQKEEIDIRKDPIKRTSELLRKVFAAQDKK